MRNFLLFHFVLGTPLMPDEEDEIVMKYSGLLGSHVEIQVRLYYFKINIDIGFIDLNV